MWGRVLGSVQGGKNECFRQGAEESVSELMMGGEGKNYKKLYAVLSYLAVFTFCTCILICLVCFVASFKLSFV